MMYRQLFRAKAKFGCAERLQEALAFEIRETRVLMEQHGYLESTFFAYKEDLYFYTASSRPNSRWEWPARLIKWLEVWPGESEPRYAVPMMDVFHDGMPESLEAWRRGRNIEQRKGSLARLKPEMYAGYVFYHYQMQEEQPSSFNKTYMIGAHENWIFSYCELPASLDEPRKPGKLSTRQTPKDWHAVMEPHFMPWPDGEGRDVPWRNLEHILTVTVPE